MKPANQTKKTKEQQKQQRKNHIESCTTHTHTHTQSHQCLAQADGFTSSEMTALREPLWRCKRAWRRAGSVEKPIFSSCTTCCVNGPNTLPKSGTASAPREVAAVSPGPLSLPEEVVVVVLVDAVLPVAGIKVAAGVASTRAFPSWSMSTTSKPSLWSSSASSSSSLLLSPLPW